MPSPATPSLDSFSSPDSANLGPNWTYPLRPGDDSPRIGTQQARRSTGSPSTGFSSAWWNRAIYTGDQEVWIDGLGASQICQVWLQLQNEGSVNYTGYGFRNDMPANAMYLTRWLNGVNTDLWSSADHIPGAGAMWLQARQTGVNTITLYAYGDYNDGAGWVLVTQQNVAGVLGSGHLGLRLGTNGQVQTFGGGALAQHYTYNLGPDTGLTVTTSLLKVPITKVTPQDTGLSVVGDTIRRPGMRRALGDTVIQPISDPLSRTARMTRQLTDTGLTVSEGVGRPLSRSITDTGLAMTGDSIQTPRLRLLTDPGVVFNDLVPRRTVWRGLAGGFADTGLSVSSAAAVWPWRKVTDTGLIPGDGLHRAKLIYLTDTGLAVFDAPAPPLRRYKRTLGDTGLRVIVTIAGATKRYQHAPYAYRTRWAVGVGSDNFQG